jgi:hypothetical protein
VVIGPALVLSVILGLFHVSAYVFIRGRAGARVPLLVIAAIAGAWAGDTVATRMAIDPLRVGEFHMLTASVVAWLGIGLVAVLAGLVPERPAEARRPMVETVLKRSATATDDGEGRGGPEPPTTPSAAPGLDPQAPR